MDIRARNDRIAEKAQWLHFRSRVPMLCECGRPGCQTLVLISLDDYHEIRSDPGNFLTAPGHGIEGAELQKRAPSHEIHRGSRSRGNGNGDRRSA